MSAASGIEIRLLRPDDDVEAELDLRRRAFGPITSGERGNWVALFEQSAAAGELIGAFDGGALVGSARVHPMRQWWRGRPVPMAGVGGVKVAPEVRGRGVGRALMHRLVGDIAERGFSVSTLFPATVPLYRSLGWEFAGGLYETSLPVAALATLIGPDAATIAQGEPADADASARADGPTAADAPELRRAGPADAATVIETLGRAYAARGDLGPATHDPEVVARWLDDEDFFAYLGPDGFLGYRWSRGTDSIRVELLAADSAATALAFWQILSSHGSMAHMLQITAGPDDPVSWLTREPLAVTRQLEGWMLRLIDAEAAVAARGFPAAVAVAVPLEISDAVLPANAGRWTLEVSGGQGKLAPRAGADATALRVGARGLAALYGGVPVATLRRAGLVAGGSPAADDGLDSAFGGRPAFMLHDF